MSNFAQFAAANTTLGGDPPGEKLKSEVVICFLFVALLLGSIVNVIFSEINIAIPYSVQVFILGMLLGIIELSGIVTDLVISMRVWANIDPDLILFIFVPALIFGEVINLNIHHVKGSIGSGLLLAGPGAVLCTILTGYYMIAELLPHSVKWTPNLAFLFASIMSATDPVAVVALLSKSHGSLQRMKYIITGESILNDASALVMFNIFSPGVDIGGSPMSAGEAALYVVKVIFISPIIGGLIGLGGVLTTSIATRHYKEDHEILQIAVPICCAYLSFYVGEAMLEVSGIITCCTAGFMFAWLSPAMFAQHETLHSVWSTLEWIGNTIIFLLAGLLITTRALVNIHPRQFANLFVIYFVVHAIRAIMIRAAFPIMTRIGEGCTGDEAIFIWFSGLRGGIAIALVLSIVQRQHYGTTIISDDDVNELLFYVGGFSCMTLLINATYAGNLLGMLEIGRNDLSERDEEQIRHYARKRIVACGMEMMAELPVEHAVMVASACKLLTFNKSNVLKAPSTVNPLHTGELTDSEPFASMDAAVSGLHEDPSTPERALYLVGNQGDLHLSPSAISPPRPDNSILSPPIKHFMPLYYDVEAPEEISFEPTRPAIQLSMLAEMTAEGDDAYPEPVPVTNKAMMTYIRDRFLQVVRTYYWRCVHTGRLSRHSVALQILLSSVEIGLETIHTPGLQDWDSIEKLKSNSGSRTLRWFLTLPRPLQVQLSSIVSRLWYTDDVVVSVLTCFIDAHEYAQQRIPVYIGEAAVADTIEQAVVVAESQKLVMLAKNKLAKFDPEHISLLKSQQLVRSIQHHQEDQLTTMLHEGILKEHHAVALYDELRADHDSAARAFQRALRTYLRNKVYDNF